jgi:hypothetical protein
MDIGFVPVGTAEPTLVSAPVVALTVYAETSLEVQFPTKANRGPSTEKLTVLVVLATTPLESCTEKTTFAVVYVAVGVPVTAPVLAFKLNPAGNVPA